MKISVSLAALTLGLVTVVLLGSALPIDPTPATAAPVAEGPSGGAPAEVDGASPRLGVTATDGEASSPADVASRPPATFEDTLPAFLKDDDDARTQREQTRAYFASNPPARLWAMHMTPVLAADAVGAQALADEPPYTAAELEAFRAQVTTFAVDLESLVGLFPDEQILDVQQRLERTRSVLATASHEDLAQLKEAFTAYPGYWNTPTYILGVLEGRSGSQGPSALPGVPLGHVTDLVPAARPTVPSGQKPEIEGCADWGNDGICGDCPPEPAGGVSTVFALDMAAFATGASCQFIPPSLLTGFTSVPNPVNVICVSIRVGLELAKAAVELANELNGECETQMARNIVLYYLDETISSRASQQSHDFHNSWELRLAIEHDLLNVLDDRVSIFQLPAAQGGYLDATDGLSVRWVVADTIRMQEAAGYAGEEIRNAKAEYDAAEALLAAGDYKSAYARYRKSYRAAVRVGREW